MAGIAVTLTQPNGIVTNWATVLSIYWQPGLSANIQIGFYVSESSYTSGLPPVSTEYFSLNISLIDPTQAIPPQLFAQLTAPGAPCAGGTLTS